MKYFLFTIWNSALKTKQTNLYNIIGLSVSFAAFILLTIYLWNEFTFDKYNQNCEQLYILELNRADTEKNEPVYWLPNPMADYFSENIPEMSKLCSFAWGPEFYSIEKGGKNGVGLATRAVDSTFAKIFNLRMKYGNYQCLAKKDGIILSESGAKNLFGDENPVGKTIYANLNTPYTVEGVFSDFPENSSFFQYKAFCAYPTEPWVNRWSEYSFNHYYQLPKNVSIDEVVRKMNNSQGVKDWNMNSSEGISFSLLPLSKIHFNKQLGSGNLLFASSLVLVAILLLIIAFVNYLNFAIANIPKKKKTINVRQVLGESKKRLLLLSFTESVFIITISFIGSIFIGKGVLHFWPDILSYKLELANYAWIFILSWIMFIVLGGIVAVIIAQINRSSSLSQSLYTVKKSGLQRNLYGRILIAIQFGISIFLLVGILFIEKQVRYFKNHDLGFDKENILAIDIPKSIQAHEDAFVAELLKDDNILDYAFSEFVPGGVGMGWGRNIDGKKVDFKCWPVDERYMRFMGFEISEGRGFSPDLNTDENNFIMNQSALKDFGWDEGYLGRLIPGFGFNGKLIGIVKDMKYASLHKRVEPLAFWLTKTRHNKLSVKISGKEVQNTIRHIENVYSNFEKDLPFNYVFLKETLERMYKGEEKQAQLISVFCIISIFVSVIGLLGLVVSQAEYRIKEVGIRKVNGAKTREIVGMLNGSFLKSILFAFILVCPISYYAMSLWQEDFAYKTKLSWWVFGLAGFIVLFIAIATVSWQSWRAANRNPVEALRYE